MRYLISASLLALFAELLITLLFKPKPLEAQLLHLQLEQTMPEYAQALAPEPAELQALFLVYVPHHFMAQQPGFGNAVQVAFYQGNGSAFNRYIGSCSHRNADIGL